MPCIVNSLGSQNDKFCLALRIGKEIRKICLFGFSKGGIFISFPYCLDSRGQLGKMTLPGGKKKFDKAPSPSPIRFTKHTVKSHHHADGHSFFSETGKIFSTHWFGINTHSFPIKDFNGHFATIMLQGTDAFELGDEKPISAKKYHPIAGCFSDRKDDAYKIVFWCYSSEDEVKRVLKEYEKYAEVPAHHTVKIPW